MSASDHDSFVRAVVIGALFFAAAYLCLPTVRWLAPIFSFAAGYMAFRFRDVLTAIPRALEQTSAGFNEAYLWVKHSNPLDRLVILGSLAGLILAVYVMAYSISDSGLKGPMPVKIAGGIAFSMLGATMMPMVTLCLIFIGAKEVEHCFWSGSSFITQTEIAKKGLVEKPITWPNVLRWLGKGSLFALLFFFFTWWTWCLAKIVKFVCTFIVLVHKKERVLAGIGGTAAGTIGCWSFYEPEIGFAGLVVLLGGTALIGAAIGTWYYQLAQYVKTRFAAPQAA